MTPSVDFGQLGINILPNDKRMPFWIAWIQTVLSQSIRLYRLFITFINGSDAQYWDLSNTYNMDDEVIYNHQVFKSMDNSNLNIIPETSIYDEVLNPTGAWQLIADNFIGMNERAYYSNMRFVLEWALNRYFKKELSDNGLIGFYQPNSATTPTNSDIYISNVPPVVTSFVSFTNVNAGSSLSFTNGANAVSFTNTTFAGATTYMFAVNIPAAVYASINASSSLADVIIRRFLDNYVPSGIYYSIVTY